MCSTVGPCWLCCVLSCSVVSDYLRPPWTVAHQAPLSMGILQARILEWVAMPSSRALPNPGIEPRSPTLLADSLPVEPPGKSLLVIHLKYSNVYMLIPKSLTIPPPHPSPLVATSSFSKSVSFLVCLFYT